MFDLLIEFENACRDLHWASLFLPGVLLTLAGLFLWLGGRRYARTIVAVTGSAIGAVLGMLLAGYLPGPTYAVIIGGAVVLGALALALQNLVIFLMAGAICAAIFGSGYLSYAISGDQEREDPSNPAAASVIVAPTRASTASFGTPAELPANAHAEAVQRLRGLSEQLRTRADHHRGGLIAVIILGAAIGLGLAFLLKSVVMALCCAVVGSAAIISGTVAILLAKQATPISSLRERPQFALYLFLGMILFGFVVQLLLTKPKPAENTEASGKNKE